MTQKCKSTAFIPITPPPHPLPFYAGKEKSLCEPFRFSIARWLTNSLIARDTFLTITAPDLNVANRIELSPGVCQSGALHGRGHLSIWDKCLVHPGGPASTLHLPPVFSRSCVYRCRAEPTCGTCWAASPPSAEAAQAWVLSFSGGHGAGI